MGHRIASGIAPHCPGRYGGKTKHNRSTERDGVKQKGTEQNRTEQNKNGSAWNGNGTPRKQEQNEKHNIRKERSENQHNVTRSGKEDDGKTEQNGKTINRKIRNETTREAAPTEHGTVGNNSEKKRSKRDHTRTVFTSMFCFVFCLTFWFHVQRNASDSDSITLPTGKLVES